MYPIDLLKVRRFFSTMPMPSDLYANPNKDQDAGRQPLTCRHVHWHIERYGHNFKSRRFQDIMERAFECGTRSRLV